jgi:hypothetical protein
VTKRKNDYPLKVDPEFHAFVKQAVEENPGLNQRKVTTRIAKAKFIIGDILFNPDFERIVYEVHERYNVINKNAKKKNW